MGEHWVDIPSWPDYMISTEGRVWSKRRLVRVEGGKPRWVGGRMLQPVIGWAGYHQARLTRHNPDGSKDAKSFRVYRLVAMTFMGERDDGQVVRHLNGDAADSRLGNLSYGTPSENTQDCIEHGHNWAINKERCSRGHLFVEENVTRPSRGGRQCKSCQYAFGNRAVRAQGCETNLVQRVADWKYNQLTGLASTGPNDCYQGDPLAS